MGKRIVSLFIMLCLVLSLTPTGVFAGEVETTGVKIEYEIGDYMSDRNDTSALFSSLTYEKTNGFWEYADNSTGLDYVSSAVNYTKGNGVRFQVKKAWFAMKIQIPVSGTYGAEVKYAKFKASAYGGTGRAVILPASTDLKTYDISDFSNIENYLHCEVNCKTDGSTTAWADASGDFIQADYNTVNNGGGVYYDAGEYYLVYCFLDNGSDFALGDFTLYTVDSTGEKYETYNPVYMGIVTAKNTNLTNGKTTSVSATISNSITHKQVTDVEYSYESSDENVAAVDKNGIVTAKGVGKTMISASCPQYPDAKILGVQISVRESTESGVFVKYEIGDYMSDRNDTSALFSSLTYEKTDGFWEYADNSTGLDYVSSAVNYTKGNGIRFQVKKAWFAMKIQIPVSGTYGAEVKYAKFKKDANGGTGRAVILPASTDLKTYDISDFSNIENYLHCEVNCKTDGSTTAWADASGDFIQADYNTVNNGAGVYYDAGEYYLVYCFLDNGSDFALGDFTLYTVDDDGNRYGTYNPVYMGKSLQIEDFCVSVRTVMSDGSFEPYEGDDVVYSISPDEIAEIDAKTGEISTKKLGTVTVTATVGEGESALVLKKSLTINQFNMDCSGAVAEYDFTKISPEWGLDVNPNEDATDAGDIRGITYQYTGVDGEGNWEYYGAGPGTDWKPGPVDVKVYPGNTASARLRISLSGGQWVALTLKIPKAGKYSAVLNYAVYKESGGGSKIYILSKNTPDIDAALTDDRCITTVSYIDKTLSGYVEREIELGDLSFYEEGEYLLVFERTSGGKGGYITPRALRLNGENSVRKVNATVDKTELGYDDTAQIQLAPVRLDGTTMGPGDYNATYKSLDTHIATVDGYGKVHAFGDGPARIEVTVDDGMNTVSETIVFDVVDDSGVRETYLKIPETLYLGEKAKLVWNAIMNSGNILQIPVEDILCIPSKNGVVEIAEGFITGVSEDAVSLGLSTNFRGEALNAQIEVTVIPDSGKSEPTYYTYERREIARENISKYDWAEDEAKSIIKEADAILSNTEVIYNGIIGEGIPRGRQIGARNDPEYNLCRYCGVNVEGGYGGNGLGGWTIDVMARPWKVQCPDCKRIFPSNNFESFMQLGLDQQGYFDVGRARQKHHEMLFHADGTECTCEAPEEELSEAWYEFYGYGNSNGYLYNEIYPELYDPTSASCNLDPLKKVYVNGKVWGVDDGFGYVPLDSDGDLRIYENGVIERHGYVALYHYNVWGDITGFLETLSLAYVYTGDEKYGRAGALILDRIADVYTSFNTYPYRNMFYYTDGGGGYGSILGRISDCTIATRLSCAVDALYPMTADSYVINFLAEKAKALNLENEKMSSKQIWENWATGILRHVFTMSKDGRIRGNYGQQQNALAIAAVSLNTEPESQEMIEWIYQTGSLQSGGKVTGGNFESQLVDVVDRDGFGNEGSIYYNAIWPGQLIDMAKALSLYRGKNNYNPFDNPKFAQMFRAITRPVIVDTHHTQIGDSGAVAGIGYHGTIEAILHGFKYLKDTAFGKDIAEYIYVRNGYDVSDLNYGIFEKDPESAEEDILSFVNAPPQKESDMMAGFGLAVLRAGSNHIADTAATAKNTLRDFWMYFGGAETSHGHYDTLNLGVEAYGLNLAPEMAYPQNTGNDPNRLQWVEATVSHNTVMVDEKNQDTRNFFGTPLHFDDSGKVKVMDIDANGAYSNTENYRRTVVMVEASDDVSYGVDFFRVTGGNKHTYSFHAQSENATPVSGIEMTKQADEKGNYIGTYAGENVAYGEDPYTQATAVYETKYPRGYTWMRKVRQDKEPEASFAVDFEIRDYRKAIKDSKGLRLRMTQMNDFVPDEVAIVGGMVPVKTANAAMPEMLEYVLVRREGENLDSMFTTVIEPYKNDRYIQGVELVEVIGEVPDGEMVRAVRVTHTNGREDYIVYATDNTKNYRVADLFEFRGFVGVYSVNADGKVIYRYVNDGDIIGSATDKPGAYSGTVDTFTNELSFENYIDVNMVCEDVSDLVGRHIYVNNDGVQNGVYRIEKAEDLGEGKVRLDIGTISVIRGHKDPENIDKGYIYNIRQEQTFSIPTSFVDESLPEFDEMSDNITTSAGSSISVKVTARSPITENPPSIEYVEQTLPRGASLDSKTGVITWKPDASQVGDSHFAIIARDSDGRESTIHFMVTVYGSTTSKPSDKTENSGNAGTTDTPAGGGAAPTDKPDNAETDGNQTDNGSESGENGGNTDNTGAENGVLRFTDLGNHEWAADAINALASDGVIKGTSETTFAPANNITRADFALILVRAFGLTSDNAENFADVSAGDYFATELAIARNSGIISGIGDNKYAPRNTITRQDMMVIVYRALQKLNVEFGIYDEPQHSDFTAVAEYAKDAVSTLVSAGLVNGKNSLIAPTDYTTRAEVAVLIKRILDFKSAKK